MTTNPKAAGVMGESVKENCEWYGPSGHKFDGSYKIGYCMCGKPEPAHPHEKVAADEEVRRPNPMNSQGLLDTIYTKNAEVYMNHLESSLASSAAREAELTAYRDKARMLAQEVQLQLEYLEGKGFGTGTSNALHAKLEQFLKPTV